MRLAILRVAGQPVMLCGYDEVLAEPIARALSRSGVERVTSVSGPVAHERVAEIVA